MKKKSMKVSLYNWLVSLDNSMLLYNGMTGSLISVDYSYSKWSKLESSILKSADIISSFNNSEIDVLYNSGFLIDDKVDERKIMEHKYNFNRYNRYSYSITLSMTTSCNFGCSYCYSFNPDVTQSIITYDILDNVISYIKSTYKAHKLMITFIGGEPLLEVEKIEYFLSRISEELPSKHVTAELITNGYLISRPIIQSLVNKGLTSIQVTMDGPPSIHNVKRPLLNSNGETHSRIIRNMESIADIISINIRVNLDVNSNFNANDILSEKLNSSDNVKLHYSHITYDHRTMEENSTVDNLRYRNKIASNYKDKLEMKIFTCSALEIMSMVVYPDGRLLKCWNEIVSDLKNDYGTVWSIKDDGIDLTKIMKWLDYNPYTPMSKCYNCRMLPTCGGGCPYSMIVKKSPTCLFTEKEYSEYIVENFNRRIQATPKANTERKT